MDEYQAHRMRALRAQRFADWRAKLQLPAETPHLNAAFDAGWEQAFTLVLEYCLAHLTPPASTGQE